MSLISVQGLSKYYGEYAAIEDISFDIKEGEIVGLLGLNGAGKSTILKILGTFLLPSKGRANIAGKSVEDDAFTVRTVIGYLPDTPPLYDEMAVVPYLKYVAQLKNVPASDLDRAVEDVLTKTNLTEVAWVPLADLSHGFRQRVGIAQALVHNPKVLILDEPINGLDPVQIVEMRDLILSLRGKHTVILSSHILSEITKTCDRILIIDKGRLVAEGTEADLHTGSTRTMKLHLEMANIVPIASILNSIPGVRSCRTVHINSPNKRYEVECEGDLRAEIATKLVEAGAMLVELTRTASDLEDVFMKLVKSSNKPPVETSGDLH